MPNGYGVYEINGDEVKWYYKGTGLPKEQQMTLYSPGKIAANSNAVVANVWNWDDKWKVEWMEDGVDKGNMEQIRCQDPIVLANYPVNMHVYSDHFFAALPTAGTKEITIKATDRFGNVYREKIQLA